MGRYWSSERSCVFAHSETLLGFASWGRPGVDEVRELLRVCEVGLRPGMTPYRWLVDLRGLDFIEPATFALFLAYTRGNGEVLGRNIVRQAQLRPDGFVGAIISGFGQVARLPYPDRVFGDAEAALGWLDVERTAGVDLLGELATLRGEALAGHGVVARLRKVIDAAGAPLAAGAAGRRLGLSTRSLQRALRDAGTTYRMELKAFRVRRAQELLGGERKLAWIAAELGFSSAQHFATAYRRAVGETPSAWRARHASAQAGESSESSEGTPQHA
jgi:AraC-like DNA-binding protein